MEKDDLIKLCQLGDIKGLEELYRQYSSNALGTAYLIAGRKGLAEDIVQESFLQCFHCVKKLKDTKTFDAWFYKILVRTAWRMVWKYNRTTYLDTSSENSISDINNSGLETVDTSIDVYEAIDKLSIQLKTVVILYYFNDMSVKNISKVLDCFESTVKSRLHNARKQLQKYLDTEEDDTISGLLLRKGVQEK